MSENTNKKEEKKLSFKDRLLQVKDKVIDYSKDAIDAGAKKIQESSMVIDNKDELDKFIEKSKIYTNSEGKEFDRFAIVIYAEKESDFYKDALYSFPVLFAKAWTQNTNIKMCSLKKEDIINPKIENTPSLVLYKNFKVAKVLDKEEDIINLVKSLKMDINSLIETA